MLKPILLLSILASFLFSNIPLANNKTTTYLIDSNTPFAQVITESKENGTEIHYTYGNDLIDDGSHYFLTDALGSTRGLVDSDEELTDSYKYKPYGELSSHDGNATNSFLFTGEQFDSETSNYYLRARYYNVGLGRFISRDTYNGTASNPITQNHYLYANANPLTYTDPSGHMNLMEINMANNIIGSVGRISMSFARIGGIISDAEMLVTAYNSVEALTRVRSLFSGTPINMFNDKEFENVMKNFDEGLNTLIGNSGAIVRRLLKPKASKFILNNFIKSRNSNFVIFAPTPRKGYIWFNNSVKLSLGRISIGRSSRKIILQIGKSNKQGGRFLGVGHQGGNKGATQWFRMDWHDPHYNNGEPKFDWLSGRFHFHISKALK